MCFWWLAAPAPARAQAEKYEGEKISGVFFEPVTQPVPRDQLGISIRIKPGDRFNQAELSRAIERLHATGRFKDIAAEVDRQADGITLTFRTSPAVFVGRVEMQGGADPPNKTVLVNATQFEAGQPFDEAEMEGAAKRVRDVMVANGFYGAKVTHRSTTDAATQQENIEFSLEPGPRARFASPVIVGNGDIPVSRLLRVSSWQRWWGLRGYKEITDRRVQEGLDNLRSYYLKRDYLLSKVSLGSLDFDPASNTAKPNLQIEAGPRILVRTEGVKLSSRTLRQLVPIYQERTIDKELLLEGKNDIEAYFSARGYFDVRADFGFTPPGPSGERTVRYTVARGKRYRLVNLVIAGFEYFDEGTIRERLSMIPASRLRYRNGRFTQELLARDRDAIVDLYRGNGFRDAKVSSRIIRNVSKNDRDIAVSLRVEEGPQWFVNTVDWTGVDLRLVPEIQAMVTSGPGQPFSLETVAADRDIVLNYYLNNGYPDVTLDAQVVPSDQPNRMNVAFKVVEGRRNFVRDILVSGLRETRPDLVASRIALHPGEPLSQGRIVETQRRLYDLGIFAQVNATTQNPDGQERGKYVLLQLDEAKKWSANIGFGAQVGQIGGGNSFDSPAGAAGFSPRTSLSISRANFLGLGHTVATNFRVSNVQQRALVNYLAPQFQGNEAVNLTLSTLADRSTDVRTYTTTRLEAASQIGQKLTRDLSAQYRITIRNVNIGDLRIDPDYIPIYSQPVFVTVFGGSLIQDRRDDPLDSTRGLYNTVDFAYAPTQLARNTGYTRISFRNSTYYRLRKDLVFARSAALGWQYNLLDPVDYPIPLPELYYGGGATSHRGFPENQAGPRDSVTGYPIGGQALLFFNHELRFPILGGSLSGVLFHDMGNVFSRFDAISFRYKQRDRQDFNYTVQAAGLGLRIKTPVGPVRLDFSYAPNSPRFVGFKGTLDDLINETGGYNVPQRVRPFQFHFSIGQAF